MGRWASRAIPLAFGLEGVRAAVYMSDGHRLLREGEVERALREQRAREAHERRLRQEATAEHERLRQEMAELARVEQARAEELTRLRRRLQELERDQRRDD